MCDDFVSKTCFVTSATRQDVESNPVLLKQRKRQLEQRKAMYMWKIYPERELPSCIDTSVEHLPPDEKFHRVKDLDFTEDATKAVATLGVHYAFESCDSLHDYEDWAEQLGHPQVPVYAAARWEMDVEFGRQMLNGVNPVVIQKCTSLPSNFPVTDLMVRGFLNRGVTLEQEMKVREVINEVIVCKPGS